RNAEQYNFTAQSFEPLATAPQVYGDAGPFDGGSQRPTDPARADNHGRTKRCV
ncbi:MAG: hypothetical protein QG596_1838, partial [Actinomycetota bacterium]|nr:hypothetical protein [Actinomycetota bacterium]